MSHKNLTEEEKKFIQDLSGYAEKVHGERWKESVKRGLNIPEEGLGEKLDRHTEAESSKTEDAIKSLRKKGLAEIREVESEVDTGRREVTYTEKEGETEREIEHRGYIRGKRSRRKLSILEIEELAKEAENQ
jgi:hypothetical protein